MPKHHVPQHFPDEIELKFYPVTISSMRKKLRALHAKCKQPMRLMRRAAFTQEQNPDLGVAYIRVRDEGHRITLSLKDYPQKEKGIDHQRELMVEVTDFESTRQILKATGLVESAYQETKREEWLLGNAEISIDIWPGLKPYIEVESHNISTLQKTANLLGLRFEDGIGFGTLRLYMVELSLSEKEAFTHFHGGKYSHLTFQNPPVRD